LPLWWKNDLGATISKMAISRPVQRPQRPPQPSSTEKALHHHQGCSALKAQAKWTFHRQLPLKKPYSYGEESNCFRWIWTTHQGNHGKSPPSDYCHYTCTQPKNEEEKLESHICTFALPALLN